MNNTESKYNGLNNAVSNRRRLRPLFVARTSYAAIEQDRASELKGAGSNETMPHPEAVTPAAPSEFKTHLRKTVATSTNESIISVEEHEQEISAATQASQIGATQRETSKNTSQEWEAEVPVKRAKRPFNPFKMDTN
jgi:hypothetical protein